jgi:hypothetical protein
VLKEFGIPEDKVIHFRAKIDGKHKVQWIRSAVMKKNRPNSDVLQSYDTETITKKAENKWKEECHSC